MWGDERTEDDALAELEFFLNEEEYNETKTTSDAKRVKSSKDSI